MQIDVAIIIILLVFAFLGFKNGLTYTLFHTFGWIIAVVASFFLREKVTSLLMDHTTIYDRYYAHTEKICRAFAETHTGDLLDNLPGVVGGALEKLGDGILTELVGKIVDITFGIFVFVGLALLIKLVLFVIMLLVSRRHHEGFVGGLDGLAGMLIGLVQGVIIVFVLLALLMPVAFALDPEYCGAVIHMLDRAVFSDILYYHNPLLGIVNGYLPDNLLPSEWLEAANAGTNTFSPDELI
jgi:hypothetical protein